MAQSLFMISSYSQKALIALYENGTPFDYRSLEDAQANAELAAPWPMKRFPILVDGEHVVLEASCVIEYPNLHHPGPVKLIPAEAKVALAVRMLDRFFDNYTSTPIQKVVPDSLRPADQRDRLGVVQAKAMLDTAYAWLDRPMAHRTWAVTDAFSLADCGAAPFLFHADWTHPIEPDLRYLLAYRKRLLARPSFARAADEVRPYRHFPLGAPDHD